MAYGVGSGAVSATGIDYFGLLQLDGTVVSPAGALVLSAGDVLRTLKLGAGAKVSGWLDGQVELAISSDGTASLDDSFVRFRLAENTTISLGYMKVYHTLSAATSETVGGLPERSMASNAFEVGTGGQLGAFFYTHGYNWSLHTGVSFNDVNEDSADTDGWGLHARATYAPVLSNNGFLHLGLSAYHRDEEDDLLSMAVQPESWLDGRDVFDSGLIEAGHYRHVNVEMAGSSGPWLVQAEYGGIRTNGQKSYGYDGGYVAASYVLTGEHRSYDAGAGRLAALRPLHPVTEGGKGAWEVAMRYSRLDLRDGGLGTFGHAWAVSLNWYPTENVRVMINAADFVSNGDVNQNGHVAGVRIQLGW